MWVLDHLDDLEADFLRFYRIDNMYDLDGPQFFSLAHRVSAYGGVMAARISEQDEQPDRPQKQPTQPPPRSSVAGSSEHREVNATQLAAMFPDVMDYSSN